MIFLGLALGLLPVPLLALLGADFDRWRTPAVLLHLLGIALVVAALRRDEPPAKANQRAAQEALRRLEERRRAGD